MNIQTLVFGILACTVLFLSFLIIIVVFVGILRVMVISVFEVDFVKAYKNRKPKESVSKPKLMGYYKGEKK